VENHRIAIPTNGNNGLDDVVSSFFGKAKTFTIVDTLTIADTQDQKLELVKVIENPAKLYIHGVGPLVAKMLFEKGVDLVLAYELGLGAETLLKQHRIRHIPVMPNTRVRKAVELAINILKKESIMHEI
jgi:predicted Fe-Mo cluster-binding NifX family protein